MGAIIRIATLVAQGPLPSTIDFGGLSTRLEIGIPYDLLWLAKRLKRDLDRSDYLGLLRAGVTTVDAIAACDDDALTQIIANPHKRDRIREAVQSVTLERSKASEDDLPMPTPTR